MTEATGRLANAVSVSQSGGNSWLLAQVAFATVAGAVLGHFGDPLMQITDIASAQSVCTGNCDCQVAWGISTF